MAVTNLTAVYDIGGKYAFNWDVNIAVNQQIIDLRIPSGAKILIITVGETDHVEYPDRSNLKPIPAPVYDENMKVDRVDVDYHSFFDHTALKIGWAPVYSDELHRMVRTQCAINGEYWNCITNTKYFGRLSGESSVDIISAINNVIKDEHYDHIWVRFVGYAPRIVFVEPMVKDPCSPSTTLSIIDKGILKRPAVLLSKENRWVSQIYAHAYDNGFVRNGFKFTQCLHAASKHECPLIDQVNEQYPDYTRVQKMEWVIEQTKNSLESLLSAVPSIVNEKGVKLVPWSITCDQGHDVVIIDQRTRSETRLRMQTLQFALDSLKDRS